MGYPDVSEVLRGDALLREDDTWIRLIRQKQELIESLQDYYFKKDRPQRILEIGCGTGIYAGMLRNAFPDATYLGVDSNPEALDIAMRRNPELHFIKSDFRDFVSINRYDLVCAHAFLKHFSFSDWLDLFPKFLSIGRIAQFDMQTAADTLNDGSPSFGNNLWVGRHIFDSTLEAVGHEIISSEVAYEHDDRRATIYLTAARV